LGLAAGVRYGGYKPHFALVLANRACSKTHVTLGHVVFNGGAEIQIAARRVRRELLEEKTRALKENNI